MSTGGLIRRTDSLPSTPVALSSPTNWSSSTTDREPVRQAQRAPIPLQDTRSLQLATLVRAAVERSRCHYAFYIRVEPRRYIRNLSHILAHGSFVTFPA